MATMVNVPDPHAAALDIITAVLDKRQQLDDALEHASRGRGKMAGLERRDRAFARLLAATVLRRLGQIDEAIDSLLDRPLPARLTRTRNILRLGSAQLLILGTAPHAAVNSTVSLVGLKSPFRGLVNAVLRRLAREGKTIAAGQDSARINTPNWLWQSWCTAHGEEQTRAIAEVHASEPPLDFTIKADPEHWANQLDAEVLITGSLRRSSGFVEDLPGYREGQWWVQDAASAIPARLLLSALDHRSAHTRILDACAAPGGKTAQLAATGLHVDALDISANRLVKVEQNLLRLGLKANLVEADLRTWTPSAPYQAILLDAPCSATGTIRRHPDILRLRQPEDVGRLAILQSQLLNAAVDRLEPGGVLIYCACSLQPEEGVDQLDRLLSARKDLERRPIRPGEMSGIDDALTVDGDAQILPCHLADAGGLDGFFIARLCRAG